MIVKSGINVVYHPTYTVLCDNWYDFDKRLNVEEVTADLREKILKIHNFHKYHSVDLTEDNARYTIWLPAVDVQYAVAVNRSLIQELDRAIGDDRYSVDGITMNPIANPDLMISALSHRENLDGAPDAVYKRCEQRVFNVLKSCLRQVFDLLRDMEDCVSYNTVGWFDNGNGTDSAVAYVSQAVAEVVLEERVRCRSVNEFTKLFYMYQTSNTLSRNNISAMINPNTTTRIISIRHDRQKNNDRAFGGGNFIFRVSYPKYITPITGALVNPRYRTLFESVIDLMEIFKGHFSEKLVYIDEKTGVATLTDLSRMLIVEAIKTTLDTIGSLRSKVPNIIDYTNGKDAITVSFAGLDRLVASFIASLMPERFEDSPLSRIDRMTANFVVTMKMDEIQKEIDQIIHDNIGSYYKTVMPETTMVLYFHTSTTYTSDQTYTHNQDIVDTEDIRLINGSSAKMRVHNGFRNMMLAGDDTSIFITDALLRQFYREDDKMLYIHSFDRPLSIKSSNIVVPH